MRWTGSDRECRHASKSTIKRVVASPDARGEEAQTGGIESRGRKRQVAVERTLVIIKPDAVQRGLVGEIIKRLESRGLKLVALDLRTVDRDVAARHYGEHEGKPFYAGLIDYITSGPSVLLVVWRARTRSRSSARRWARQIPWTRLRARFAAIWGS